MKRIDYLERILKARVYDVAAETPLEPARALSKRLRNTLLLKREDLQSVFSFKLRGAYNKMAGLPKARLRRGVIAASAGNHAQGVALAAQRLKCRAVRIIGVEPVDADAMSRSLKAGRRIKLEHVGLFADGVAVKEVGRETFRLCKQLVDDVVLVDTDEMCAAIKDVFEDTRVVLEPAGALAVAGAKAWVERHKGSRRGNRGARGKTLVAICSGANTNFDRLRFIAEEAEVGEHREAVLAVTIPERPGSFKKFCATLGGNNITEFNYRIADSRDAHIFVGIEVDGRTQTDRIVKNLRRHALTTLDLSDNEMAKLHLRHMVGGRAPFAKHELLYRFEFPERRGALMQILQHLPSDRNIGLFHHRNHGADYGRVLVGIQVPKNETRQFRAFLRELGYPYADETRNPAYRLFLV